MLKVLNSSPRRRRNGHQRDKTTIGSESAERMPYDGHEVDQVLVHSNSRQDNACLLQMLEGAGRRSLQAYPIHPGTG